MPLNRNALIRYTTIDRCLRNPYKKWTLEDLIDACSDALYEYEGITEGVSKRTVQLDIQLMRSEKLGYNAPIVVYDRKYYKYENPDYSITNIPLTHQDLEKLTEVTELLKQFKGFMHFQDLGSMVQKLEDKIYAEKNQTKPIIEFEKNDNLKGLNFLDVTYKAILNESAVKITYQSYTAKKPSSFIYYPYLLKEYNNRWFILGKRSDNKDLMNLALDRIIEMEIQTKERYIKPEGFIPQNFYKDVVGVTVNTGSNVQDVRLFVKSQTAPYIITKPLHESQKIVSKNKTGIEISLKLIPNIELEREILSYGKSIKVLAPEKLKKHITKTLMEAIDAYRVNDSLIS